LAAIEALGPPPAGELPHPPDAAFDAGLDRWRRGGRGEVEAGALRALEQLADPTDGTRALLRHCAGEGVLPGGELGEWLQRLAHWLAGGPGRGG
jgi:hypothetical protein